METEPHRPANCEEASGAPERREQQRREPRETGPPPLPARLSGFWSLVSMPWRAWRLSRGPSPSKQLGQVSRSHSALTSLFYLWFWRSKA